MLWPFKGVLVSFETSEQQKRTSWVTFFILFELWHETRLELFQQKFEMKVRNKNSILENGCRVFFGTLIEIVELERE